MPKLQLDIVSATGAVYSGEADVVVAPASDGEIAILPNHAALITTLKPGPLRMRLAGEEHDIALSGGFLEIFNNRVTVLADQADEASKIDFARAEEAVRLAQQRISETKDREALEQALLELSRAQVRLSVARRHRERHIPRAG